RLPTDGDDVDAAVAVEVLGREVFHGDAAVVEDVPGPFRAGVVERFVEPHAAPLAGLVALVVPDADDEFVFTIAVEVSCPDSMAPLQAVVDDLAIHELLVTIFWCRVNDYLVTVPRLNCGNPGSASFEVPKLDLAGTATALGVRLVPLTSPI